MKPRIFPYHPAVVIFGAGATKGAFSERVIPPPVDTDFFNISHFIDGHGTQKIARQVLRSVWELYGKTNGIGLEEYFRDIEARAHIGKFAKSTNYPKDWNKRQEQLTELIRRIYIHTTCEAKNKSMVPCKSHVHQVILNQLKAKDTLITFNYDLVIEEAFANAKLWNPHDGYGSLLQGKTFDWVKKWFEERHTAKETKSKVTLLKLHGSINWKPYANKAISLKQRPYCVRARKQKVVVEKVSILAPGWHKKIDTNPYKLFWRRARLDLEKCQSVVIIGYSLPPTDILAQALFSESVRLRRARSKYLKALYIADPNRQVKEKFIDLFTPCLGANSKVFTYDGIKEFSQKLE